MIFIGYNRHLYMIILAIFNVENYQFTVINNSLEDSYLYLLLNT